MLLVDVLACTLRRVPLAGLPLLTIYSVPVSMLGDGVPWWVFALTAGGFLLMLFLQESTTRWSAGAVPSAATRRPTRRILGVRTGAVRATAGDHRRRATALAVIVPFSIPTLGLASSPAAAAPAATTSRSRTR